MIARTNPPENKRCEKLTDFMGEKSSTMLHSVAEAVACTLGSGSPRSRKRGSAMEASTRLVRRFLTDRERLLVHEQAAARTPGVPSSSPEMMGSRALERSV